MSTSKGSDSALPSLISLLHVTRILIHVHIRRSCLVAGFDYYMESHTEGLQIIRYNTTNAYQSPHTDFIAPNDLLDMDLDSSRTGGNRFATFVLYLSDHGTKDGGETVFTEADSGDPGKFDEMTQALKEFRSSTESTMFEEGSWQESLVATCRSRFSVQPKRSRALLFYSQNPDGLEDLSSKYAECPLFSGTKYVAKVWVWSTPREGSLGYPKNPRYVGQFSEERDEEEDQLNRKLVVFRNSGENPAFQNAQLYLGNHFYSSLGFDAPAVKVKSYEGHVWHVKVNGEIVQSFTIGSDMVHELMI